MVARRGSPLRGIGAAAQPTAGELTTTDEVYDLDRVAVGQQCGFVFFARDDVFVALHGNRTLTQTEMDDQLAHREWRWKGHRLSRSHKCSCAYKSRPRRVLSSRIARRKGLEKSSCSSRVGRLKHDLSDAQFPSSVAILTRSWGDWRRFPRLFAKRAQRSRRR